MSSIDKVYKDMIKFRSDLDKEYDTKTDFSRNELVQDKWTKDIQNKIFALRRFNQADVLIALN